MEVKTHPDEAKDRVEAPGNYYLCQISETVSCGACCGLYNVENWSRRAVEKLLQQRRMRFSKVPRTVDAILSFGQAETGVSASEGPFPDFHHCPYLGLIGPGGSRVGCMLHPLADGNRGIDFRGLSDYGGMACRSYFCPTHSRVPGEYKRIVRGVFSHWHPYGLVVTESELIVALFRELEDRLGKALSWDRIARSRECQSAVRALLEAKINWPFRPAGLQTPTHYFFNDRLYRRRPIDYEALGAPSSAYDRILEPMSSFFSSAAQLQMAESLLDHLLNEAVRRHP